MLVAGVVVVVGARAVRSLRGSARAIWGSGALRDVTVVVGPIHGKVLATGRVGVWESYVAAVVCGCNRYSLCVLLCCVSLALF
jgi:hypothetical protein